MSLLGSIASTTSEILFGPPAPLPKDVPPKVPLDTPHKPLPPPAPSSPNMTPLNDMKKHKVNKGALEGKSNSPIPARDSSMPRQRGRRVSSPSNTASTSSTTQPPIVSEGSDTAAPSLTETLVSSGVSVLSVLGSLVASSGPGIGSSVSTTTHSSADEDNDKTPTASRVVSSSSSTSKADEKIGEVATKDQSLTEHVLSSVTDFLWTQAGSAKDAALASASTLSAAAIEAAFPRPSSSSCNQHPPSSSPQNKHKHASLPPPAYTTGIDSPRSASRNSISSNTSSSRSSSSSSVASNLSYIPPQYDSAGMPFSQDPAVAAMQRIPDFPCQHSHGGGSAEAANRAFHCCVPPPTSTSASASDSDLVSQKSVSRSSSTSDSLAGLNDCSCECFKTLRRDSTTSIDTSVLHHHPSPQSLTSPNKINDSHNAVLRNENKDPDLTLTLPKTQQEAAAACACTCHDQHRYQRGKSGHFHRVEQLVRGTKRVVRDIKNVI